MWQSARVIAVSVAVFLTGACGSAIAHQSASAVGSHADSRSVQQPSATDPSRYPAGPTPSPEQIESMPDPMVGLPGAILTLPQTEAAAEAEGLAPATPPPSAPTMSVQSPVACDWHGNLAKATMNRAANWIILDTGAWGRAEVPGNRIWIAPRTPCDKVYSVAVHEWTHHMQGVIYRDWDSVRRELAPYGGPEIVADCGALILGATWINYGCPTQESRNAAAAILRGQRP